MIGRARVYYRDQAFHPGWLGVFTNPFYLTRKNLRRRVAELAPSLSGRVLDVGCGTKPYERYFQVSQYVGLEVYGSGNRAGTRPDCFYDGRRFPFGDGEFDGVITSQVLEHVFDPYEFLGEINRVLKMGALLLLTVPFIWDEHEQPYDYGRYTSFGLAHLLRRHEFEIVRQFKSLDDVRALAQLANAYLYKLTATANPRLNVLTTAVLMSPLTILGEALAAVLPGNEDLYLDNVVLARKVR